MQCDNGKEFLNSTLQKICDSHKVHLRLSCPYTFPQNEKVECKIRTINNILHTLLTHASLPLSFWPHALQIATYLLNILPSKPQNFHSLTPTHTLFHKFPSYSLFRVFGCLYFHLIPSPSRHKLEARSTSCVFLGYPQNHRGYKCFHLKN